MIWNLIEKTETVNGAGGPFYSVPIKISSVGCDSIAFQCNITVASSSTKTFLAAAVNITTDQITVTAHGFTTGRKIQIANPGTLPTGISGATDYFVIYVDANTISLATSLALAQAGTVLDITAQGSGTNTITPTALAGGAVSMYQSNDNLTYVALGSSQNVTTTGTLFLSADRPASAWVCLGYVTTAGQLNTSVVTVGKGDKGE
jgi:hypothetical protein